MPQLKQHKLYQRHNIRIVGHRVGPVEWLQILQAYAIAQQKELELAKTSDAQEGFPRGKEGRILLPRSYGTLTSGSCVLQAIPNTASSHGRSEKQLHPMHPSCAEIENLADQASNNTVGHAAQGEHFH